MAHPIKHFFVTNGLPWNTSIEQSLHEDGYDTVELLKVMEEDEWSALFTNEKKAKRRLALTVFQDLRDAPVNTSNCATKIPFTPSSETTASASTSSKKKRKKKNHTDDNNDIHKMEKFGFFLKKHKKNTDTTTAGKCDDNGNSNSHEDYIQSDFHFLSLFYFCFVFLLHSLSAKGWI